MFYGPDYGALYHRLQPTLSEQAEDQKAPVYFVLMARLGAGVTPRISSVLAAAANRVALVTSSQAGQRVECYLSRRRLA